MSLFDDFLESTEQETRIAQDDQKNVTTPSKINKVNQTKNLSTSSFMLNLPLFFLSLERNGICSNACQ